MTHFPASTLRSRGVTLIELLIVLAILGIITAIAYPMYGDHVRKGHRAAAQSYMMVLAGRQGEILPVSNGYAPQTEMFSILPVPATVSKHYTVTMTTSATPPKFEITATPVAGTKQVIDGTLKLDQAGVRFPADKW